MGERRILRWAIVLVIVLLGGLFAANFTINDNALDLLPDGAVRGDLQLLQQVGLVDRLFITLRADEKRYPTAEEARKPLQHSAENLGRGLVASENFTNVLARLPAGSAGELISLLLPSMPLLIDQNDLAEIDRLTSEKMLTKVMHQNFLLLNSPAGIAAKKQIRHDPLGFLPILLAKLGYLQAEFSIRPDDRFLMSRDGRSTLVLAESRLTLTDSKNSEQLEKELAQLYGSYLLPGITAEIIGTLPHTLANSRIIKNDLRFLLPTASVLLIVLLGFALRDIRAVLVFGVPFLGAVPAITITTFVFGEISALALGFGIVILGISVDFSVHLFLALTRDKGSHAEVLREVQRPIIFATLTTVSVLVVLFFSDVSSHRQMATLALSGILFGVLFAWLLVPTVVPEKVRKNTETRKYGDIPVVRFPNRKKMILTTWLLLLATGIWAWPHLSYNGDLRVLDAPDREVMEIEKRFGRTWGDKGEQAFVAATGSTLDEALESAGNLFIFLRENGTFTIQSPVVLLPDRKTQETRLENWRAFWQQKQPEFSESLTAAVRAQGFSDRAFQPFWEWIEKSPEFIEYNYYLNSAFAPLLGTMVRTIGGTSGQADRYLVLTTVGIDDTSMPSLLDYGENHPSIKVLANRKWRAEVEHLLKKDILLLSGLAACVVVFLVGLQFRRPAAVGAVLAPVVSALAAMSVFCWATSSELNMMHLIMGIMVIGLSVDYGIFIVCSRLGQVSSATPFAVSVCAASSLIGFGVLSFADHPALYSLGITVLVGIGTAWPVALLVSPLLLDWGGKAVACID